MQALLISSVEQINPWEASYSRLLEKIGGMESLYYAAEHLRLPVTTFEALGVELFAILVIRDDEVVAVLPFQRQNDWPFGIWKTIRFVGDIGVQMDNCYPLILADGFCPEAIDAAVELLTTRLVGEWDTMDLSRIRLDNENMQYFVSRFAEHYAEPSGEEFYYFEAAAGLDQVLGSRKLSNLRRRRRRLEEEVGPVAIVVKPEVTDADIEEIAAIHSVRQRDKEDGDAFFEDEAVGKIVRDMFHLSRRQECMRYYSLRAGDRAIAIAVMIHTEVVSYGFLTAFDPEFAKHAPSRILTYEVFRQEVEDFGVERIETSWGANELKKDFSSGAYALHDVEIVGSRRKSRAVHQLGNLLEDLERVARNTLRPVKRMFSR